MHPETVLAVDIGNSRVHAGIVAVANMECQRQDACSLSDMESGFDRLIRSVCNGATYTRAVVGGVVERAVDAAIRKLGAGGFDVSRFTVDGISSIDIHYADRAVLGSDRCANTLYVHHRFPGKRVVVVSAGSALVVDLVENGAFFGGAILPGAAMQCRSLYSFTDALPDVACVRNGAVHLPGTTTAQCIESGVLYGIAGAIEKIVDTYAGKQTSNEMVLCATGGDWSRVAPLCKHRFLSLPDMTLVGTALFLRQPC